MVGTERRSEIAEEEIEDNGLIDDANDFLYPDEDWDDEYDEDDEPEEREYCD